MFDRLLGHDAWTSRQLLLRCQDLSEERLDHAFDAGLGSVRTTLLHTIGNAEVWTALRVVGPLPVHTPPDARPSAAELLVRQDTAAAAFRDLATGIARERRRDQLWLDRLDHSPHTKTNGGAIAHVLTRNHFHRAELRHMLARLGLGHFLEGDVLSWEERARLTRG